jgi:hypothetical protein
MTQSGRDAEPAQSGLVVAVGYKETPGGASMHGRAGRVVAGMVRVSIRVPNGAMVLDVAVQAESIQGALGIVRRRYPHTSIRVAFPIDTGRSFVKDSAAPKGFIQLETPARLAACKWNKFPRLEVVLLFESQCRVGAVSAAEVLC